MSWATGAIVVLVVAIGLPWAIAEVTAVVEMRRRARRRAMVEAYLKLIDGRDAWRTK